MDGSLVGAGGDLLQTGDHFEDCLLEVLVEHSVEDGVDQGAGVTQPLCQEVEPPEILTYYYERDKRVAFLQQKVYR